MKAILVREFGGPDVLKLEEVPTPKPAAGEMLVRVHAAGARRKRRRGYRSSTNRAQYGSHDSRHRWNTDGSGNSKARARSGHHSRNARQGAPSFRSP